MDFDESCRVSGEMKARAWLIGDRAGTLIGLYHRGVEFARIMCTTSGAVSKEDMKEVNTADCFAMAGPHVREGVREVMLVRLTVAVEEWDTPWSKQHGAAGWLYRGNFLNTRLEKGVLIEMDSSWVERCQAAS